MPFNTVRQTRSVKLLSDRNFQRVLAAVREGNTLDAACSMKNMPTKEAVLKLLSDSPECEAQMVRARRIDVWMQLDSIHDRLNAADPAELQVLKELASHIRWLAGKFVADMFETRGQERKDVIEVRWTEAPPNSNEMR
jgi:hypothetical protein